ncbi:hypothetical protein J3R30DRAFT_3450859 [Lentinula aciculospora]|uniref:Uncharacterized protein n=1 Tax=Lentinula aciculospora TaxID=153920 RepID=A0A9W9DS05_9AGAR|nr:hypothetical protein J3R30DRAFT_3450859 [Lentinula aciculospora]
MVDQDFSCPESATCMTFESPHVLQQQLTLLIIPAAFGLLLYGIFTVLFGLSIYIFRRKFTPGKLHIIATLVFYTIATVSVILDLVYRCGQILLPFLMYQSSVGYIDPSLPYVPAVTSASEGLFLCASSLADVMLIRRCYRLWNSRKRVVFVPVIFILASLVLWIITITLYPGSSQAYMVYISVTLLQNLYLSVMIAGRICWNNQSIKKIWVTPDPYHEARRDLFGPILESAMITPIFLIIWVALFLSGSGVEVLSSCVLTQVVGISFTFIIVRIGLGIDVEHTISEFHSPPLDVETSPFEAVALEDLNQNHSGQDNRRLQNQNQPIQPFDLKYTSGLGPLGNSSELLKGQSNHSSKNHLRSVKNSK